MESVEQIRQAIVFLANRCDGAVTNDGVGYCGTDTNYGKSLARQILNDVKLSPKQLETALKMLRKYEKNQLNPAGLSLPPLRQLMTDLGISISLAAKTDIRTVELFDDRIEVRFDYNANIIQAVKTVQPKGRYNDNSRGKYWTFGLDSLVPLIEKLLPLGFQMSQDVLDYIETLRESERLDIEETDNRLQWVLDYLDEHLHNWDFKPFKHQLEGVEFAVKNQRCLIADDMGLGKAQVHGTPVLTPSGWVQIEDLQVGDRVIGSNGHPTTVTGVYPQGIVSNYEIKFTDGSTTWCCGDHLWYVEERTDGGRLNNWKVLSTREMLKRGVEFGGVKRYRIPMVKPVEFDFQDVPIDPYAMGYILGNGSISQKGTMISTKDEEIIKYFSSLLPDNNYLKQASKYDWTITAPPRQNHIGRTITELGLRGCRAEAKFIPHSYKFNTFENRLALFQGLMDSDGSWSKSNKRNNTGNLQFSSSSEQLANDVKFLVESFGGIARVSTKIPYYTYKGERKQGQKHYSLNISLPPEITPFRLERKLANYCPRTKYKPTRLIKSINYVGEYEAACISVNAIDRLYVTENFIVTHNTVTSLISVMALQAWFKFSQNIEAPIFVIAPVSLKMNWLKEAGAVGVAIEVFSYGKVPVAPASEFIAICDEMHFCQNIKSQRTKKVLDLVLDDNCLSLIALTGTPMKNGRPSNIYPILKAICHPVAVNRNEFERRYCNGRPTAFTAWDTTGASNLEELNYKISDLVIRRTKEECLDLPPKIFTAIECETNSEAENEYREELVRIKQNYYARVEAGEISGNSKAVVFLGYLRRLASIYKSYQTIEMVQDLLDQGQSVVVFTEYVESAQRIADHFGVQALTGETAQVKTIDGEKVYPRQLMVDMFQSGETRVFVGTIKAGGVGITLTRSSYLIMNDRPWTPGDYQQATDRIHRIGQTGTCNIYDIYGKDIDYVMAAILDVKSANIDKVLKKNKIKIEDRNKADFYEKILEQLLK